MQVSVLQGAPETVRELLSTLGLQKYTLGLSLNGWDDLDYFRYNDCGYNPSYLHHPITAFHGINYFSQLLEFRRGAIPNAGSCDASINTNLENASKTLLVPK